MMKYDITENYNNGLCCSCGVCVGSCPKQAIKLTNHNGMYLPQIDQKSCVHCGICFDVCPGYCQDYTNLNQNPYEAAIGPIIECWNSWSNDNEIRHVSASGGTVTALIRTLLDSDCYDFAFCVDEYCYESQLITRPYDKDSFLKQDTDGWKTPKSRYLPVSHANMIRYIISHPDKKIIIVAVPCAVQGIENVIDRFHLTRDNYLIIGLFCEKAFQYNLVSYYQNKWGGKNKRIIAFHFKNKESGGWPGNMKLYYSDGTFEYMDKTNRTEVKGYFQPERCLYCIDKLSVKADISLGDNYTGVDESPLGTNSCIVRTNRGLIAWNRCSNSISKRKVIIQRIAEAAALEDRVNNASFAEYKKTLLERNNYIVAEINKGISCPENDFDPDKYQAAMKRLACGQNYIQEPNLLYDLMDREKRYSQKRAMITKFKRILSKIKQAFLRLFSSKKTQRV